jgi:hypothetical protein
LAPEKPQATRSLRHFGKFDQHQVINKAKPVKALYSQQEPHAKHKFFLPSLDTIMVTNSYERLLEPEPKDDMFDGPQGLLWNRFM